MANRNTQASCAAMRLVLALAVATAAAGCSAEAPGQGGTDAFSPSALAASARVDESGLMRVKTLTKPSNVRAGKAEGLSANDLILVDFFQLEELDRKMRVDSNGMITMPLVGTVRAGGRSIVDLEAELERLYGERYLENPEISVLQIETQGRVAFAGGEFEKSGNVMLTGRPTLTRVVSDAGGLTRNGDPRRIFVFRRFPDRTEVARFDLTAIHKAKARDPDLYRDDVVIAFPSKGRVAFNNLKDALGIAVSARSAARPF